MLKFQLDRFLTIGEGDKMNVLLKVCIGWFVVFTLTGCIGEEYDFTPPTITLLDEMTVESDPLAEANVAWRGPENVPIKKDVGDISSLAKKQPKLYYVAGGTVSMLFDHTDFVERQVSVSAWKNRQK